MGKRFSRLKHAKRSYDPFDIESVNHTEFWVIDDIDSMFGEDEHEPVSQTQGYVLYMLVILSNFLILWIV